MEDIEQDAEKKIDARDIALYYMELMGLDFWDWRGKERIHRWCQVFG